MQPLFRREFSLPGVQDGGVRCFRGDDFDSDGPSVVVVMWSMINVNLKVT